MIPLAGALRDDTTEVLQVLIRYLEGCHYGDLEKLRSVLTTSTEKPCSWPTTHPACCVAASPAPADQGEPFSYEILNIDVDDHHAVAMLSRALPDKSEEAVALLKVEGAWYIDASRVSGECRT